NVSIIFFSAAKDSKERKISEASVSDEATKSISINDEIDSDTESARSDIDADSENEEYDVKEALMSTEQDIELFKKQIVELGAAVCNTADRFDKIQEALDKVVENLRLGKPIEPFLSTENTPSIESETQEQVQESTNVNKIQNSHDIYDRERLLEVLRNQAVENKKNPPRISVGMIGYPNVGKSSERELHAGSHAPHPVSDPGGHRPAGLSRAGAAGVRRRTGPAAHSCTAHRPGDNLDIDLLDCPGLVLPAYAVAPDLHRPSGLSRAGAAGVRRRAGPAAHSCTAHRPGDNLDIDLLDCPGLVLPAPGDNLDIDLLDCPGLVLPAYAVAPDLLLTAVLAIDQVILRHRPAGLSRAGAAGVRRRAGPAAHSCTGHRPGDNLRHRPAGLSRAGAAGVRRRAGPAAHSCTAHRPGDNLRHRPAGLSRAGAAGLRRRAGPAAHSCTGHRPGDNLLYQVSVSSMPGHTRHIQSLILEDIDLLDCPGLVLPAYAVAPDLLLTAVLPIDQVSESSMPGHTRHIQSLILEDIDLLDCPGLVLPAYAVAPDLLLTAVLPIDQMRAHDAAMARLCELVSKHTFEEKYGLLLPEEVIEKEY
ncbi:Large subunit GTPase 1-like protein, partial [Operophtera brumata]